MSQSQVGNIHLSFLEDVLPVGMALFDRAKKGGARQVMEGLISSDKPMEILRVEGAASALLIREKLDQIRPGLGNPVVEVQVSVKTSESNIANSSDPDQKTLINLLNRIDNRIDAIQNHLENSINLRS